MRLWCGERVDDAPPQSGFLRNAVGSNRERGLGPRARRLMVKLLFTALELEELARTPRSRMQERLNPEGAGSLIGIVGDLEASFHAQLDRYESWTAHMHAFLVERRGSPAQIALVARTRAFFTTYPELSHVPQERPDAMASEVTQAAVAGDYRAALSIFDDGAARWRCLIDFHRDWISQLLTDVYQAHGVDELEAVLRYTGVRSVLNAMKAEIARPVGQRLRTFVRLLHGHFSEVAIVEDDEKFTITQDPCGTCSRQVTSGRYGPPLELAVVKEAHATTWWRGDTPVYRCHIPIWHFELALEKIGVPCPVNQCPAGVSDGPCRILLYKDPLNTSALDAIPHGT